MVETKTIDLKSLKRKKPTEETFEIDSKKPKLNATESNGLSIKMRLRSASKTVAPITTDMKEMKRKYVRKFNFPNLPYVCQRRFAEICDFQTLNIFASDNSETRKLSRHFHIVDKVAIFLFAEKPVVFLYVKCFCTQEEYCNKNRRVLLPAIKEKIKVMNKIDILSRENFPVSSQMIDNLPINFDGIKKLRIMDTVMHLNNLKKLIKPKLKEFVFLGGIHSPCRIEDFINFINDLETKLDKLFLNLKHSSPSFNFYDLKSLFTKNSINVLHDIEDTTIMLRKRNN